ncbi:insulin-like [Leuresthes tenuis]|uniref:insulin-like n=1 Tax=Leuresthes tenuis TaxID=355514 RepID=UPI003B50AE19
MAKLWIHTAALLVLLVMSCPSSQAIGSHYLCGSHLVDALYLVCGERGFTYRPGTNQDPVQQAPAGGETKAATFEEQMGMMGKRSIVERCCHMPCSLMVLESYCH